MMTREEIKEMNARIGLLIGTSADQEARTKGMDLSDKVRSNMQYRKMREKLEKITEKYGMDALRMTLIDKGYELVGFTPKGKSIQWYRNSGMEERSRYCGTLRIDGQVIFTSGTIAKCYEYMVTN